MAVKKLLLQFLNESTMVASWGISNIDIRANGISFSVNGFKYGGQINVIVKNITHADIVFVDNEKEICDIYIHNVVFIIDNEIEVTKDYSQTIKDWLQN